MDAFHGTGQRYGITQFAVTGFRSGEGEQRTDTFAACKQAVSHCLVEGGGLGACGGKVMTEGSIHLFGPLTGVFLEVK